MGNSKKDIDMNLQGFKYPDRIYGSKFNSGYNKVDRKAAICNGFPAQVNKPIRFGNLQSLSYYNPTIVTREYQREAPPNLVVKTTKRYQEEAGILDRKAERENPDKVTTTYAQSFYKPNDNLRSKINQSPGIRKI